MEPPVVDVLIERCRPGAVVPGYARPGDGGMDVVCPLDVDIPAGATVIVPAGFKVALPEGWMLLVFPRSGMSAKTALRVANSPGLIDAGYRDEVGVVLHNTGATDVHLAAGTRMAQLVLVRRTEVHFIQVDAVAGVGRNRGGGFGHTG